MGRRCPSSVAASLAVSATLMTPATAPAARYVQQAPPGAVGRVCLIDTGVPEGTPGVVERLTATGSLDARDPHGAQMAAIIRTAYAGAQIISVQKVDGRPTTVTMADVVDLCVARRATVIGLSFVLPADGFDRPALQAAVDRARAADVVLVAAAGNARTVEAPANLDGVIAVGATDGTGTPCAFSASGSGLVMAPGCDIDNAPTDGTSDATAYVVGTAAARAATQGLTGAALEQAVRGAPPRASASDATPDTSDVPYLWVARRERTHVSLAVRGPGAHGLRVRVGGHTIGTRARRIRVRGRTLRVTSRCGHGAARYTRAVLPSRGAGRAVTLPLCRS